LSVVAASDAAQAAALLSGWWSRPLETELAAWDASWPVAAQTAETLGLDAGLVEDLAACSGSMTEEFLDEYERLFVGPGRTPCPPYESLWLGGRPRLEQGRLMGAASVAVADPRTARSGWTSPPPRTSFPTTLRSSSRRSPSRCAPRVRRQRRRAGPS